MSKQSEFHASRRAEIKKLHAGLTIIPGNSFVQASADRPYSFEQDGNFFYLTGLQEPGLILVMDDNSEQLIIPKRSPNREAFEGKIDVQKLASESGISSIRSYDEAWPEIEEKIKKSKLVNALLPAGNYIAEAEMFINPIRQYLIDKIKDINPKTEIKDIRPSMTSLRTIKSDYEIDSIKHAINQTEELFKEIEAAWPQAKNESDLLALAAAFTSRKQLSFAYDPIIGGGKNAVTLHYINNNTDLRSGENLLLDIGLKSRGYSADITRTVNNRPKNRQQQVYEAVLDAQKQAISLLKPDVLLKEYEERVVKIMEEKIQQLGLKNEVRSYYPHSASHFLGIDVHDTGDYKTPLKPGTVLTVEPGLYIAEEDTGVRIEDDILITESGSEVLTNLPRNLSSLTMSS